jgi:excisionase family DNA binding protein
MVSISPNVCILHDMHNNPELQPDWLTASEVAILFHVSQPTISRWADTGRLPSHTLPSGRRRFRRDEIEALLGDGVASL